MELFTTFQTPANLKFASIWTVQRFLFYSISARECITQNRVSVIQFIHLCTSHLHSAIRQKLAKKLTWLRADIGLSTLVALRIPLIFVRFLFAFFRRAHYPQMNSAIQRYRAKLLKKWQKFTASTFRCQRNRTGYGSQWNVGWPISRKSWKIIPPIMPKNWLHSRVCSKLISVGNWNGSKWPLKVPTIQLSSATTICKRVIFYSKNITVVMHRQAAPPNSWGKSLYWTTLRLPSICPTF